MSRIYKWISPLFFQGQSHIRQAFFSHSVMFPKGIWLAQKRSCTEVQSFFRVYECVHLITSLESQGLYLVNWNWKGKFSVFPLGQKIYNGSKWVQEPQLRALAGTRLKHRSRRIGYHLINESWCNKDRSSLKGVLCKKENISMHSCYFGNRVLICIRWGQKAIVIIIFSQHKQGVIHAYYINILELFRFSVYMYVFSPVTRAQISEASLY